MMRMLPLGRYCDYLFQRRSIVTKPDSSRHNEHVKSSPSCKFRLVHKESKMMLMVCKFESLTDRVQRVLQLYNYNKCNCLIHLHDERNRFS